MNSKTTGTAAMQALSQNYQFNLSDFALFLFDSRGSRQIAMQAWLLGSLLAEIKPLMKVR